MNIYNRLCRGGGVLLFMMACLWPFALFAAPACVEEQAMNAGGTGGTGMLAEGGIGGTGDRAEGGIGGTGIVGTVTGFASVCINGLEVHYEPETPVTRNGVTADVAALALGQVVAIDAANTARGLVARQISILNALEGPVTAIQPERGELRVMGQAVHVDGATRLDGVSALTGVHVGMALRVTGFRGGDGAIFATRIEAASRMAEVSAIGILEKSNAGQHSLEGLPVQTVAMTPATGSEVLLRGAWDGQRLIAQTVQVRPSLFFAGHVGHVVAEGIAFGGVEHGHLHMSGFDVDLSRMAQETHVSVGQRIRVAGRLEEGNRIVAHDLHIGIMPGLHAPLSAPMSGCKGCQPSGAMMQRMGMPPQVQQAPMPMGGSMQKSPR